MFLLWVLGSVQFGGATLKRRGLVGLGGRADGASDTSIIMIISASVGHEPRQPPVALLQYRAQQKCKTNVAYPLFGKVNKHFNLEL